MADRARPEGALVACTIVARNYLPAATVLAESYLRHHPGGRFVITVIDAPWSSSTEHPGWRVVGPAGLGIPEEDYLRMATAYSVTELATAVKPYLLRQLRARHETVVYLDPDIEVFAPMPELADLATTHGIVLTPHFLGPLPRDGLEPTEAMIMGSGIFNLGFIAVGPGSADFLEFWAERLRHDAIVAPDRQMFTDQRWVDQVPALFGHHSLRDPGFNVAYWNLHERALRIDADGTVTAGGRPVRFFHFSGYRPEKPFLLTHHTPRRPRVLLSREPDVRRLCDRYAAALYAAGYATNLDAVPYGFATMADGTVLTPTMRRLFRRSWMRAERTGTAPPPHAFEDGAGLGAWLAAGPDRIPADTGLNRLTMAVWAARPDLRAAFPEPYGRDAEAFRTWCRTSGVTEEKFPDWAIPAEPEPPGDPDDAAGVNLLGYLTAELGVGEMGRILHDALAGSGVPVAAVVDETLVYNRTGLRPPETLAAPRFPVSLLCVNADQTAETLRRYRQVGHNRYRIGLWAWELNEFPEQQHGAYQLVDEVWTVSEFCREAIARHSPVPVKVVPVPVSDPGPWSRPRQAGQPVRFLFAFDYFSIAQRKNPWGLVKAFQLAFPDRSDVRLVLKTINADKHPEPAERLRLMVADDPRIELIEHYLSVAELHDLYARSDCYVSLHRSEGFGLTVAEAMVRGMPVVATDYSGTAELLDKRTGWPVRYRMIEVGPGQGPYPATARWADPDLDDAAAALREVADNPTEANRRGQAARAQILRMRPADAATTWLRDQLAAAHQSWRAGRHYRDALEMDPLRPLRDARQALLWRPEPGSPARLPLAPMLRRAVLRAIDHYDVHQRHVQGALVDGIEGTLRQLATRLAATEDRLRDTQARLAATEPRLAAAEDAVIRVDELAERSAEVFRRVDELAGAAPGIRTALEELDQGRDVDAAHRLALHRALDELDRKTFEGFRDRDTRADDTEQRVWRAQTDLAALHEAARLRHAPVPAGAEVVVCDAGALLLPTDHVVLPWLVHHRSWEAAEAELMARLAGDGTFVDIGAHVGYHTLRLLHRAPGRLRVVAVEADPTNAEYLRRNLAANLSPETLALVTVLPMAAWDADTTVRLVPGEPGNSGDYRVAAAAAAGGVAVPAVRLDGRPEITAAPVGLIKVDLQGRDHRALSGLAEVLERDRPHVLCEFCPAAIEDLGDDPGEVLLGYRKAGYHPVPVGSDLPAETEHSDEELIGAARTAPTGFLTLWLAHESRRTR